MTYLWDTSHIQPRADVVMPGETMPAVFWNAVKARGPNVWMRQKHLGIWRSWSWQQTGEAVREISHGLMALGFEAHDTASILSNTTVEWVLCDLGVLSAGGVSNGIYPTDAAEQVQYLCEDSRTTVLFVENDEQLDKALEVRDALPLLKKIVVIDMDGLRDLDDPGVISLDALRQLGREHHQAHPGGQQIAGDGAVVFLREAALLLFALGPVAVALDHDQRVGQVGARLVEGAQRAADAAVRSVPRSGDAGMAFGLAAAGATSSSGSGFLAEGGVGVGVPLPGAVSDKAGATAPAVGMIRNWPSRTARSGPRPFQSASDLAETL